MIKTRLVMRMTLETSEAERNIENIQIPNCFKSVWQKTILILSCWQDEEAPDETIFLLFNIAPQRAGRDFHKRCLSGFVQKRRLTILIQILYQVNARKSIIASSLC